MLNKQTEITIFGNTEYTQLIIDNFNAIAIVDETNTDNIIAGLPNTPIDNLNKNLPIINCVNNSRAYQAQEKLVNTGFQQVIFVGDLINQYPDIFANTTLAKAKMAMKEDKEALLALLPRFNDEESKHHFQHIIDFRATLNIEHLSIFEVKIDEQYYEPFVEAENFEYLIDGGAYDGSDSKKFAERFPGYKKIYVLEPSKANSKLVHQTLQGLKNYQLINACIGEKPGKIGFSGEGMGAKPSSEANEIVDVITLNSLETYGKTLVKLDIEGAEIGALTGAKNLIDNPDYSFAISSYHLPHDLRDIISLLMNSQVDRKYYFRHYSGGFAESVFFAI